MNFEIFLYFLILTVFFLIYDFQRFPNMFWDVLDFFWFSMIYYESFRFSLILLEFLWFPLILWDFLRLYKISCDSSFFSVIFFFQILCDFIWFPNTIPYDVGFLRSSMIFVKKYHTIFFDFPWFSAILLICCMIFFDYCRCCLVSFDFLWFLEIL